MAKSSHGGLRKGAGRKSKAVKLLETGFVAPWLTAKFQEIKWNEFVNHKNPKIALEALKYVTDRIHGKAVQQVDNKGEIEIIKRIIVR